MPRTKGRYEAEGTAPAVPQALSMLLTPKAGALAFALPLTLVVPATAAQTPHPESGAPVAPEPVDSGFVNQSAVTVTSTADIHTSPMSLVKAESAPEPRQEATGEQEQHLADDEGVEEPSAEVTPAARADTNTGGPQVAADTHGASTADSSGARILQIAEKYVGVPYVWGGTTPSGWDCSGFTRHVFNEAGVNLPRTSGAQKAAGTVVPAAQARPGDLVWRPGHIGIYAGNGMMYDAGTTPGTSYRSHSWMGSVTFIRVL